MFCPSCGVESTNKNKYCKNCGANLGQNNNTVEVHIPPPPVARMSWAIAVVGLFGFITSIATLFFMLSQSYIKKELVAIVFCVCLLFIFMICILLAWPLWRLVGLYRDSVRQAVKTEYSERVITAPPVNPPQPPLQMPVAQEPIASVTEHTTRSFSPSIESGSGSK